MKMWGVVGLLVAGAVAGLLFAGRRAVIPNILADADALSRVKIVGLGLNYRYDPVRTTASYSKPRQLKL